MNELMIVLGDRESWIYYKTTQLTPGEAFYDFLEKCESAGIIVDNMEFDYCVLRDSDGNDISSWKINR